MKIDSKVLNKNTSKPNPPVCQIESIAQSREMYHRNARMVQHIKSINVEPPVNRRKGKNYPVSLIDSEGT